MKISAMSMDAMYEMTIEIFAFFREIFPVTSGRSGWLVLSVSMSNRSFMAFPPSMTNMTHNDANVRITHSETTPVPRDISPEMKVAKIAIRAFAGLNSLTQGFIVKGQF